MVIGRERCFLTGTEEKEGVEGRVWWLSDSLALPVDISDSRKHLANKRKIFSREAPNKQND